MKKEQEKEAPVVPVQTESEPVVKSPKPEKIKPEPCDCEGLGV